MLIFRVQNFIIFRYPEAFIITPCQNAKAARIGLRFAQLRSILAAAQSEIDSRTLCACARRNPFLQATIHRVHASENWFQLAQAARINFAVQALQAARTDLNALILAACASHNQFSSSTTWNHSQSSREVKSILADQRKASLNQFLQQHYHCVACENCLHCAWWSISHCAACEDKLRSLQGWRMSFTGAQIINFL